MDECPTFSWVKLNNSVFYWMTFFFIVRFYWTHFEKKRKKRKKERKKKQTMDFRGLTEKFFVNFVLSLFLLRVYVSFLALCCKFVYFVVEGRKWYVYTTVLTLCFYSQSSIARRDVKSHSWFLSFCCVCAW